jgi:hypothetical protein
MTRIAPTLTLLAVAALGAGMFVANAVTSPSADQPAVPVPAAVAAPASPSDPHVISLAELPVVGAPERTEVSLADLPVVGATDPADKAGRTEISLGDITVVQPAVNPGAPSAFAGRTNDDTMSVAVAVQGTKAEAYVCNGGKVEAWLSGTATDGALSLKSKSGRSTLTGTVGPTAVDGSVTVDGVEAAYTAASTDVATAAKNGRADVGTVVSRLGGTG